MNELKDVKNKGLKDNNFGVKLILSVDNINQLKHLEL